MSLPSSEPLPDNINDLPPARQRHIRRLPRSATPAERQILLDSLVRLTAPTPAFFLFVLTGALLAGVAFYLNDPAVLIAAVITLPLLQPVFGLGLVPATLKSGLGFKSLISLLLPLMLTFASGSLAGWLRKFSSLDQLGVQRFASPYWLDLTFVFTCALLGALVLLRKGHLPRLIGMMLSYEILIPLATAGFGFILGNPQLWPGALLVSLLHLGVAVFSATVAFLLLGFAPKRASGWLSSLVPLVLILVLILGMWNFNLLDIPFTMQLSPTPESTDLPSETISPKVNVTATPTTVVETPTLTQAPSKSPTLTTAPTQTATFTLTPTLEPTTYWGVVDSLSGAVIRELPDFDAVVIAYVYDGDQVEILRDVEGEGGTRWYQIMIETGETGWLLGSLVDTPTPAPTP